MFLEFMITIIFILIHIITSYLNFIDKVLRRKFLSIAGGVAVSYAFMHILPELSKNQITIEGLIENSFFRLIESHIYIVSLLGLVVFYGLEKMSKLSKQKNVENSKVSKGVFWVHVMFFFIYNVVTGYLLVKSLNETFVSLLLFGIAIGLHFFVVDYGLRDHHHEIYDRYGRWILSLGSLLGFILAYFTKINELIISLLFAFLAGGIILNILKEELPEERKSSFTAFFLGALIYSLLLIFI